MAGCVFCSIQGGEVEAEVVYQDPDLFAILDHRPVFEGHTLLMPRAHHETLPDLPPDLLAPLFAAAQKLSVAVPSALGAQGSFVAINNSVSQSVPHLHVHVVPRRRGDGLRGFFWPRTKYASREAMAAVGEQVRAALHSLR